jgi:hypothetical protein
MVTAATHPSSFPLFSTLAGELPNEIWHHTLREDLCPALYFFKHGCGCQSRQTAIENGYENKNDHLYLDFD